MAIPESVQHILHRLTAAGHEAYVVGGCVRDRLLGKEPNDWDICTSALPEETEAVFQGYRVIETGLKHGTVTVMLDGIPYEITTFRQDGDYADHRRPAQVQFVRNLTEDLARRDFTVNAMAMDHDGTLQDPFYGQEDLKNGVIRCVGDPNRRFQEDALRILRGLRFASSLGFSIHPETAEAMEDNKDLLQYVSAERVYKELTGLLVGKDAAKVLAAHGSVLTTVLPEIAPAMGFPQKNPHHNRDVWGHTLEALSYAPPDPMIRWALLLHDLGKPDCFFEDQQGIGHFHGHPVRSEELAQNILRRLKADTHTRTTVCTLVLYHDYDLPANTKNARRWVAKFGTEAALSLLEVKRCDCKAHADIAKARARCENTAKLTELVQQVMRETPCFSSRDLAVSGQDILQQGIPSGPMVGQLLNLLLEDVLEERCENDRQALLIRLGEHISQLPPHRKDIP